MVAIPVVLTARTFDTKAAAEAFFTHMLDRYEPGQRVGDADASLLRDLLRRHPRCEEKVGAGIDHFEVRANIYGTKSFGIVRTDGSKDDFSIGKCIYPERSG